MKSAVDVLRGGAVAIVGTGLVGMGWAVVFARAGATVHLYDANPQVLEAAPARILRQLEDLDSYGLLSEPATVVMSRIKSCASLSLSLEGATYVQESILERVDHKRALMEQLQSCDDGRRIIGSSTSGIPASQFANNLAITPRVIIVHPVNPPSLVPLVELVPSPRTAPRTLEFASELMAAVGQTAITVHREIEGFVLNRSSRAVERSLGIGRRWHRVG